MMGMLQRLLMSIGLCVSLAVYSYGWKVDCTKFVFAPKCRGVAAKRNANFLNGGDMVQHIPTSLLTRLTQLQNKRTDDAKPQAFRLDFTLSQADDPKNEKPSLSKIVPGDWENDIMDYNPVVHAYPDVTGLKAYLEALAAGGLIQEDDTDYSLDMDLDRT